MNCSSLFLNLDIVPLWDFQGGEMWVIETLEEGDETFCCCLVGIAAIEVCQSSSVSLTWKAPRSHEPAKKVKITWSAKTVECKIFFRKPPFS